MKKFFSLMLVALLLVSALPFQAFATGTTCAHEWAPTGTVLSEATCQAKKVIQIKCTKCNAIDGCEDGALADHVREDVVSVAATCDTAGYAYPTCKVCGSTAAKKDIAPLGHKWDAGTVTTPSTCAVAGVITYKCTNTGCNESYTEPAPLSNDHEYQNGVCRICQGSDGLVRSNVTFIINNVAGVSKIYYQTYIDGNPYTVPTAELISNYEFKGWYEGENGSGDQLTSGSSWDADENDTWYAWYVYNPNKDGMSTITVTARCYIDGIGSSYLDVPVLTQALPDNTNVFDWLTANKNTSILTSVYSKVDTTKYEWKDRYFYNHNGTEVLTEQTVFADGPKAILIKLVEKDNTTRANVQLYLHTSTTAENPFRILDMNGYTSGMNVTRTAAANLVKEYYSYKNIGNLFTESDWNALQNGENVAGRTSVYIADNGTYKIHVVVTNASSKSSSNADPSNPKTGDYITIAVGTMVMAAAAFITLAEMKKRKMI